MEQNRFLSELLRRHERIRRNLMPKELLPGAILARQDDPIKYVIFPTSGMVSTAIPLGGDFVDVGMIGCDGVVGGSVIFGAKRHLNLIRVCFSGSALMLPASVFADLSRGDGSIGREVSGFENWLLVQAQQITAWNAKHSVTQRLSRWLLQADRAHRGSQLPATQDFIGQLLGVSRATIAASASELQKKRCITYKRGLISIDDGDALKAEACECHSELTKRRSSLCFRASEREEMVSKTVDPP